MHFTRLGRAFARANDRTITAVAACAAVRFSVGGETDSARGGTKIPNPSVQRKL